VDLRAGSRIGPYEVLSLLGRGGMGEVYRAHDHRLRREVAVKVLHSGADQARRIEQEARAASALNHPGIVAVYDVGQHEGRPYLVTEYVEGQTLLELVRAGIGPSRALDVARQVAHALAAAHDRGIVHRDLKPANVVVDRDGRARILDFGLARPDAPPLLSSEATAHAPSSTGPLTLDGALRGTLGYAAPEQVRGRRVDARTDIFAFGVVLYEMLGGRPPFLRDSTVQTLLSTVEDDVPELAGAPPELLRVARRCLEKDPERRFQSARDLAFHLDALAAGTTAVLLPPPRRRTLPRAVLPVALALAALAAAYLLGRRTPPPEVSYQQLTFRRGTIYQARFDPQGQTVVYSAGWEGQPAAMYASRPDAVESRLLDPPNGSVHAISSRGEMAVLLLEGRAFSRGRLARIPLLGGPARPVLDDVEWADFAPDGEAMAVVRLVGGRRRLEFPIGEVVHETGGWISHPRVTPDGRAVALIDHPSPGDNRGSVLLVQKGREPRTLAGPFKAVFGLAVNRARDEVWFTASQREAMRVLYAVTRDGELRDVLRVPLRLTLQDVSADGKRVLVTGDSLRRSTFGGRPDARERDLTWLDYTNAKDLSADGRTLLFSEDGEGGGSGYAVYLRPMDGGPAVRLGAGKAMALSPDGSLVLTSLVDETPQRLHALPTGVGSASTLPAGPIARYDWAIFMPGGRRIVVAGAEATGPARLYVQDLPGGAPRAVGGDGIAAAYGGLAADPGGRVVAGVGADRRVRIYPLDGSAPSLVAGTGPSDIPVRFSADGGGLYVYASGTLPTSVDLVDLKTGERRPTLELMPADPSGVLGITRVRLAADGRTYAYSFSRILSDLFLVDGL
jgi:predicted Ser/Thr protein kinase/WD40 repeat protein